MKRFPLAITAASLAAALLPATASASEVQIGQTATALAAPTCPAGTSAADCTILLTEMTGMETSSDGITAPTVVNAPGVLSSFTIGISSAAKSYLSSLNKTYAGPPEAEVTVLRKVGSGASVRWAVAAEGPVQNLTNYQGDVVEFPLGQELPLVKGEIVALTSPTWAPVLSIDLSTRFGYIQSRTGNCAGNAKLPSYFNPQTLVGEQAAYGCAFSKTRVEYSATEITTPSENAALRLASRRQPAQSPRVIKR